METKIVTAQQGNLASYAEAVEWLSAGEVVAFPTETVYGLGAVATNEDAVLKIFAAKNRPADNPLIVHIGTVEELTQYVAHVPDVAKRCIEAFWPGALTLVMEAKPGVIAPSVMPGRTTVGMRMPDHPVALELLQALGQPLAAPSANRSGKPSPTKAMHVYEDLNGIIPGIVDGGATGIGLESTVLDVTLEVPVILRPGGVTKEMLEAVIGPVLQPTLKEQESSTAPKAPGMKYTHYAPNAPVYLLRAEANVAQAVADLQQQGHKVALLAPASYAATPADYYFSLGEDEQLAQMGALLYEALRSCDKTEATIILATATDAQGVGAAIMNRLEKAAGGRWYR